MSQKYSIQYLVNADIFEGTTFIYTFFLIQTTDKAAFNIDTYADKTAR